MENLFQVEFDHELWYRANLLGRGDKVHNLQLAMTLYKNAYNAARNGDLYCIQSMKAWHKILRDIVFSS